MFLEDTWRRRNPQLRDYSWSRGNKSSRIDYWLISKSLESQVDEIKYTPCPFSDHKLVELSLRRSGVNYGRGVWKMNSSVIMSELFQKAFSSMWIYWVKQKSEFVTNVPCGS